MQTNHRILELGITALALLIAFAETRGDREIAAAIYLLIPIAALVGLAIWFDTAAAERNQGTDHVAPVDRMAKYAGVLFVTPALLGLVLGLRELEQEFHGFTWRSWIFLALAGSAVAAMPLVFWRRHRDLRGG